MGLKESGLRGSIRNVSTGIGAAITIDTLEAEDVGEDSATIRGEITELENFGEDAEVFFEWGEITEGLPNTTDIQLQDTVGVFTEDLTNLSEDTEHEFQAFGSVRDVSDDGVVLTFETGDAIPDSVVHHWFAPEDESTFVDIESGEDATLNGPSYESSAVGGLGAFVADGSNDYSEATRLPDWRDNVGNDFAVAFAFENETSDGYLFGQEDDSDDSFHAITADGDYGVSNSVNGIKFVIGDGSDRAELWGDDTAIDDGNPHAVILNAPGGDTSDWQIYTDNNEETEHESTINIDGAPFPENLMFHCRNNTGSASDHTESSIHEVMFFDDALSSSERDEIWDRYDWV